MFRLSLSWWNLTLNVDTKSIQIFNLRVSRSALQVWDETSLIERWINVRIRYIRFHVWQRRCIWRLRLEPSHVSRHPDEMQMRKIHRSWQIAQETSTSWRKREVDICVCINSIRQRRRMIINIYSICLPPNSLESMGIVGKTKDPLVLHWQRILLLHRFTYEHFYRHSIGAIVRIGANVWTCERLVRCLSETKKCKFQEKKIIETKISSMRKRNKWMMEAGSIKGRGRMIFVETNQKKKSCWFYVKKWENKYGDDLIYRITRRRDLQTKAITSP